MKKADWKTKRLLSAALLIVFLISMFVLSLAVKNPANTIRSDGLLVLDGQTMGTTFRILLHENALDEASKQFLSTKISLLLNKLDREIFSTYVLDSQLSQLNRTAPGKIYQGSSELLQVLIAAQQVHSFSKGAFDISIKPLVDLWGFGATKPVQDIPARKEIEKALESMGMENIILDSNNSAVIRTKDVTLDLSAIAKGFAVDQLSLLLEAEGQMNYLVEIGGEVVIRGIRADGDFWQLGIESPEQGLEKEANTFQKLNMSFNKTAIAASGNYRNFFMHEGRRYSHTLNPVTGWPVNHDLIAVTVIAESAMLADAWATALMVLGLEEGMKLANELQLAAYFITLDTSGYQGLHSESFNQYL
jgi:FAD:protein FMN transferase